MKHSFLKQLPLFNHLDNEELESILESFEKHSYKKNEVIIQENSVANCLYIVFTGSVKLFKSSVDGKEHILRIMQQHEIIGEVPMFEGGTYPASCMALTDSELLSISRINFLKLIKANPKIALGMLALQAKRLREFTLKIEKLTLSKTEQRLADFCIKKIAVSSSNQDIVELQGMTIQDLANYLGVTRENISRIISKWIKLGFVAKEEGKIVILDTEVLNKMVSED